MMYRAFAIAIPTALLASGCAEELDRAPEVPALPGASPDTASAAAEKWPDVQTTRKTTVLSAGEASARWLLPPKNRWAPYQKTTLLAALDATERVADLPEIDQLDVVVRADRAARAVAAAGLPAKTMWVVDLRGAASVAFGAALSANSRDPVAPVMTFHNWPAQNELIPAEETLAALVSVAPKLPSGSEDGQPVFMLDAWRLAYRLDPPDDGVTDNRYMLLPSDLPAPDVLLAEGIDHIFYVVESLETASKEEDDLHETFGAYQAAGIAISMVDLDLLEWAGPGLSWEEWLLYTRPLYIDPNRATIVSDPSFYLRARGGFGGPRVIHGGAHGFGGGHHSGFGGHGGG
jgi:hypothetical protein